MKYIKKLLVLAGIVISSSAHAVIIQGESSTGVYNNVKVDTNGVVSVSATSTVSPSTGALTDHSGSLTLGGAAQNLTVANATRKYLFIQNTSSGDEWINFTTTAVESQPSILLKSNASFVMEGNFVSTEAVSIIGATTGQTWTAKEF